MTVFVIGGGSGVDMFTAEKDITRKLTQKVQSFIWSFDGLDEVEPFEFKLNIPNAFLKA